MMRIAMSPAAAGLLRSLLARAGLDRDRILLTEFRSTDWQSLTFVGERHELRLRVVGADAESVARALVDNIAEAEFSLPGHFLADIEAVGEPSVQSDGSATLTLEALTVAED